MTFRANADHSAHMAYSGGGSRALIDEVDDSGTVQTMKGTMMKGEGCKGVECFQNYGFSSHNMPADKGEDGQITYGAETVMSYMGGSRSSPMGGVTEDARHRVKGTEKGDSCMYRTRDDGQQYHMTEKGNFMSCRNDRVQRFALIDPPKDDDQQQRADQQPGQSQGQGGQAKEAQAKKPKGQKVVRDANEKSENFWQQSAKMTETGVGKGHQQVTAEHSTNWVGSVQNSVRAHKDHAHTRYGDNVLWVDGGGVYASMPPIIQDDGHDSDSPITPKPGAPAGPPRPV